MKIVLLIVLIIIIAVIIIVVSKRRQSHLKFFGIPIDGTFVQIVEKMKAKGWPFGSILMPTDDDTRLYDITIDGDKGVLIVKRSPKSKVVYSISFYHEKVFSKEIAEQQVERSLEALRRAYPNAHEWINNGETQLDLNNGVIVHHLVEHDDTFTAGVTYIDTKNQNIFFNETDGD